MTGLCPTSSNIKPESESPPVEIPSAAPSGPSSDPRSTTVKGSAKLNRWSRARSIRSGRKLERSVGHDVSPAEWGSTAQAPAAIASLEDSTVECKGDLESAVSKSIYMVSDGTGWTADHTVHAALELFQQSLVDRRCPVNTHLFSGVEGEEQLMEIIKQAAREGAMIVYTVADPSMAESAKRACELWGVPSKDILGPITEAIASHLGVSPSGLSRDAARRRSALSEDYFRRIEAIEFTIKQDDGILPENLDKADIILLGVSRTGKTPLSTYLAQKGYKVANVPIVMGMELPRGVFEVDPRKVFGLTINPVVLQAIRKSRAKSLRLGGEARSSYSEMEYVRRELEYAGRVFAQNPVWPVIEVTNKAIEETAAVVLRLYHDGSQGGCVPRISKRF